VRSSVSYDPSSSLVFLTDQATTAGSCWAFAFDPATGKLTNQWHTRLGFSTSTPAVYGGRVYLGTGIYSIKGGLYCLDEASGSVVWKFLPTSGGGAVSVPGVQASPVVAVQNGAPHIYFSTICEHSTVYCLDQNGHQVWQFHDSDSTYALQGVAVADGWLYFGNDGGWVYALRMAAG
jgi:outer membrane protein assembly factor BamB